MLLSFAKHILVTISAHALTCLCYLLHRLLSMKPNDDCTSFHYVFCSNYIMKTVLDKLATQSKVELEVWCSAATHPLLGKLMLGHLIPTMIG